MSTNKNTFKYLCFVFGLALVHLIIELINPVYVAYESRLTVYLFINAFIPFLLMSVGIFFAAKCTGLSSLFLQLKAKALTFFCAAILSPFVLIIDLIAVCLLMLSGAAVAEYLSPSEAVIVFLAPVSYFVCLAAVPFAVLALCKLITLKSKIKFPRGTYMALCFAPPILYLIFAILQMAVYYISPNMMVKYQGINAFTTFYSVIKDLTIGWSIFCMFKYNQSMRIKALLEMQKVNQ